MLSLQIRGKLAKNGIGSACCLVFRCSRTGKCGVEEELREAAAHPMAGLALSPDAGAWTRVPTGAIHFSVARAAARSTRFRQQSRVRPPNVTGQGRNRLPRTGGRLGTRRRPEGGEPSAKKHVLQVQGRKGCQIRTRVINQTHVAGSTAPTATPRARCAGLSRSHSAVPSATHCP